MSEKEVTVNITQNQGYTKYCRSQHTAVNANWFKIICYQALAEAGDMISGFSCFHMLHGCLNPLKVYNFFRGMGWQRSIV